MDIVGHREKGKTTFKCLIEDSRVEGGSDPGSCKRDENLRIVRGDSRFWGNRVAKGLADLGGDCATVLTGHTTATKVEPMASLGLGRCTASARPVMEGGPRKTGTPVGGPAGDVSLVLAGSLASRSGTGLGDRDGGPAMPVKSSAENVLSPRRGAGRSRMRSFSNPDP
jgi:hypothetical protein